jgi:hypothetical protein
MDRLGSSGLTENTAKFLPEPRVAIAWDPAGRGKTSITAYFGLHHSLLDSLDFRFDQSAPYNTTLSYSIPRSRNTISWVSQGYSNYNGLQVDVRRSLAQGLPLRANYTFARNLDNGSAWNTSVSANTPAHVSYPAKPRSIMVPPPQMCATWPASTGRTSCRLDDSGSFIEHQHRNRPSRLRLDCRLDRQSSDRLSLLSAARLQPDRLWRHT